MFHNRYNILIILGYGNLIFNTARLLFISNTIRTSVEKEAGGGGGEGMSSKQLKLDKEEAPGD